MMIEAESGSSGASAGIATSLILKDRGSHGLASQGWGLQDQRRHLQLDDPHDDWVVDVWDQPPPPMHRPEDEMQPPPPMHRPEDEMHRPELQFRRTGPVPTQPPPPMNRPEDKVSNDSSEADTGECKKRKFN